jgi:hypothetical protein
MKGNFKLAEQPTEETNISLPWNSCYSKTSETDDQATFLELPLKWELFPFFNLILQILRNIIIIQYQFLNV